MSVNDSYQRAWDQNRWNTVGPMDILILVKGFDGQNTEEEWLSVLAVSGYSKESITDSWSYLMTTGMIRSDESGKIRFAVGMEIHT